MKRVFTLSFILFALTLFSQEKTPQSQAGQSSKAVAAKPTQEDLGLNPRTGASSGKSQSSEIAPLPYDVNDKYMGRKAEFLNNITLTELPSDFPVYEKQWGLKEYNQVVDAFYMNHKEILKDRVREKIEFLQQQQ